MTRLGVNIDHVATLRQARGTSYPSPVMAAQEAIRAGAHQITVHLREDRRHIQERDVWDLREVLSVPLNLEMAATASMQVIALAVAPDTVTLVPERRREVTTEGGLDLRRNSGRIARVNAAFKEQKIRTSAFIEADRAQVDAAVALGFDAVEFHTGKYCDYYDAGKPWKRIMQHMKSVSRHAKDSGLLVFAGHGINEANMAPLLAIREIEEYNIGHSIVSQAIFFGMYEAVRRMMAILESHPKI